MSKKKPDSDKTTLAGVRDLCQRGESLIGGWTDLRWVDGLSASELRTLQRDLLVTSRDMLSIATALSSRIRIALTEQLIDIQNEHPDAKLDLLRELGDV